MPIFYEKREFVTPGDLIAEGDYAAGDNTYKEGGKIYVTRVGLVYYEGRRIYVVALKAFYVPIVGDLVIGKVVRVATALPTTLSPLFRFSCRHDNFMVITP